jgi:hypothetical protein
MVAGLPLAVPAVVASAVAEPVVAASVVADPALVASAVVDSVVGDSVTLAAGSVVAAGAAEVDVVLVDEAGGAPQAAIMAAATNAVRTAK